MQVGQESFCNNVDQDDGDAFASLQDLRML